MRNLDDEEPPLSSSLIGALRDEPPSVALRERTIRGLRADGAFGPVLAPPAVRRVGRWSLASRLAAAGVIFAAGLALGSMRSRDESATTPAVRIQEAARAYVRALALANPDSGAAHAAALRSFRDVAGEIDRLLPYDQIGDAAAFTPATAMPPSSPPHTHSGSLLWY